MHKMIPVLAGVSCVLLVAGCGKTETPAKSAGAAPAVANSEPRESEHLKQEMFDLTVEAMRQKKPNTEQAELEVQARTMVDKAIQDLRKHDSAFMIVSPEVERKLQSNEPILDAPKRVGEALETLIDFGVEIPGLSVVLLEQHKAGTLSPRRTELLAHLLAATVKKLRSSLAD